MRARSERCRGIRVRGLAAQFDAIRTRSLRSEKIVRGCDDVEREYLLRNTRETDALRELRRRTSSLPGSKMQVPPEQAQFMSLLVELIDAKRIVEVGVYTGYSSLAMALSLPKDGMLVAIDKDETTMSIALEHWEKAGVKDMLIPRCGPAKEILQGMLEDGEASTYDLAFIDADKRSYMDYYELCLDLLRPGGLLLVDNTLFYGTVADETSTTKVTQALREFNEFVYQDARVSHSLVPIGDGLTLCRKRRE